MGSFVGATFKERGSGTNFPIWTKTMLLAVRNLPAGNLPVVQQLGMDVERLALVVRVTAAELAALYDQVHESGSLIYGWETVSAFLDTITDVTEVSANRDTYFATLNVIRLG